MVIGLFFWWLELVAVSSLALLSCIFGSSWRVMFSRFWAANTSRKWSSSNLPNALSLSCELPCSATPRVLSSATFRWLLFTVGAVGALTVVSRVALQHVSRCVGCLSLLEGRLHRCLQFHLRELFQLVGCRWVRA